MQDQLIVFMGLAEGETSILCGELTLHTRTAIAIVQTLLPAAHFQV
jgi:RNA 3'-terminal phosphate cyclase (ATP)